MRLLLFLSLLSFSLLSLPAIATDASHPEQIQTPTWLATAPSPIPQAVGEISQGPQILSLLEEAAGLWRNLSKHSQINYLIMARAQARISTQLLKYFSDETRTAGQERRAWAASHDSQQQQSWDRLQSLLPNDLTQIDRESHRLLEQIEGLATEHIKDQSEKNMKKLMSLDQLLSKRGEAQRQLKMEFTASKPRGLKKWLLSWQRFPELMLLDNPPMQQRSCGMILAQIPKGRLVF